MSFAGNAGARPPRLSITNLRSGETYYFPFTPETFKETVKANWAKQTILGMSHNNLQYSNTDNHQIDSLNFFFRGDSPEEIELIHEGRKFLLSLLYPSVGANSVREGGPPQVLFVWPQMISMNCVIEGITISHEKFNREGLTTTFRAEFGLTEIRDTRLTSEDVRAQGTLRSGVSPAQLESEFYDYDFASDGVYDFDFSNEG